MTDTLGFFGSGGNIATVGVSIIDHQTATAIRAAGFDPAQFDSMRWPIGAGSYAHGMYLMDGNTIPSGVALGDSSRFRIVNIDPLFDKMFLIDLLPVMLSESAGVMYAGHVVDDRYFWRYKRVAAGMFNMSMDDRSKRYDSTEQTSETPHTPRTAIESLIAEHTDLTLTEWEFPAAGSEEAEAFDDADNLRDLDVTHWPFGQAVDCILSAAGFILVAYPSTTYSHGDPAKRYAVVPIGDGESGLSATLNEFAGDLLGGGVVGATTGATTPVDQIAAVSVGGSTRMDPRVPSSVVVAFPTSLENGAGWVFNEESESNTGRNYVTDRWQTVETADGLPAGVTGNGESVTVYDHIPAIIDANGTVTNQTDLDTRAAIVSTRYYDRFRSGTGHYLFRDILPIRPSAAAQVITWTVTAGGVYTRIDGTSENPLFGHIYTTNAPSILALGGVRATPRPDGKVILDSPPTDQSLFPALLHSHRANTPDERDEWAWNESQLDDFGRWATRAGGLSSADGANQFKNPAAMTVDYPPRDAGEIPVWLRKHVDTKGVVHHLFEPRGYFPVKVIQSEGNNGTSTTPATYRYIVLTLAGKVLGESNTPGNSLAPEYRPMNIGPMSPAPPGSTGQAYFNEAGALRLFSCQEKITFGSCP